MNDKPTKLGRLIGSTKETQCSCSILSLCLDSFICERIEMSSRLRRHQSGERDGEYNEMKIQNSHPNFEENTSQIHKGTKQTSLTEQSEILFFVPTFQGWVSLIIQTPCLLKKTFFFLRIIYIYYIIFQF